MCAALGGGDKRRVIHGRGRARPSPRLSFPWQPAFFSLAKRGASKRRGPADGPRSAAATERQARGAVAANERQTGSGIAANERQGCGNGGLRAGALSATVAAVPDTPSGTALVTGAANRIGRAIALALAPGHAIAVHYRDSADAAAEVAAEIAAGGGAAVALHADLDDETATGGLLAAAAEALGPVTVLVNNASVFERDSVRTASAESWQRHMAVNLRAPFVLSQAMAASPPAGRTGNIVNLIDQRVWNLTPHFTSYTVSKAGLWTLTRTLALALAPRIRVNAIGPGPTLASRRQTPGQFAAQARRMPLGAPVAVAEIAAAVRFVLDSPSMTGQMIALDGGQHLGWQHAGTPDEPDE